MYPPRIESEEKLLEKTREQRKRDLLKKLSDAGLGDGKKPEEKLDEKPAAKKKPSP